MTGSGTAEDPYIIEDVDDLQAMENDPTAYYELGGDIDASPTQGWNGVKDSGRLEFTILRSQHRVEIC